jgi:hypothetical protein
MFTRYLLVALILLTTARLRAGEILDQMVATVNGHAILESDWDDELRYECFMSGRSLRDLSAEDRRATFERLIDQELLREQMGATDFKPAGAEEIAKQMEQLKQQYSQEHSHESWETGLRSYGIPESQVAAHVGLELNALRLVDARLRPSIQIDTAAEEEYYKKEILPKLSSGEHVSLQEATPKIRELLVQQKMNELLSSWLQSLRAQGQIQIVTPQPAQSRDSQ